MRNIILDAKIKKELRKFQEFKKQYNFVPKEIEERKGALFCDGVCIRENEDAELLGESETFVNVGYKLHGALPKILSNLFPYKFYFKGQTLSSAESFFQGIKFKDIKAQKQVFLLSGLDSNNIKAAQDYHWKDTGTVYFLGKPYNRFEQDYENLVDEMYVSLLQNPLFTNALKAAGNKYILHAMGEPNPKETVFSRLEFEKQLNTLKDYCLRNKQ